MHALGGAPAVESSRESAAGGDDWVQCGVARVLGWPSGGTSAGDRALWRLLFRGTLDACVTFDSIKLAFCALQQQRQVLLAAKPPADILKPVSAADGRPGPCDGLREAALSWREAMLTVDLLRMSTRAAQVLLRARRKRCEFAACCLRSVQSRSPVLTVCIPPPCPPTLRLLHALRIAVRTAAPANCSRRCRLRRAQTSQTLSCCCLNSSQNSGAVAGPIVRLQSFWSSCAHCSRC